MYRSATALSFKTTDGVLRVDDLFLRGGATLGAVLLCGGSVWYALAKQDAAFVPASPGLWCAWVALAVIAPLGLLVAGWRLRQRDKRATAVLRLVDRQPQIAADDLVRNSDISRREIEVAIRDINNAGAAYLVWDRDADVVLDGRLRRTVTHAGTCGACSADIVVAVELADPTRARCPFCDAPLGADDVETAKQAVLEEIAHDRRARSSTTSAPAIVSRRFSAGAFLLLAILFWPGAILYALRHARG